MKITKHENGKSGKVNCVGAVYSSIDKRLYISYSDKLLKFKLHLTKLETDLIRKVMRK